MVSDLQMLEANRGVKLKSVVFCVNLLTRDRERLLVEIKETYVEKCVFPTFLMVI